MDTASAVAADRIPRDILLTARDTDAFLSVVRLGLLPTGRVRALLPLGLLALADSWRTVSLGLLGYLTANAATLGEALDRFVAAHALGFSKTAAFSRAFTRWTRRSPAAYRRAVRSAGEP